MSARRNIDAFQMLFPKIRLLILALAICSTCISDAVENNPALGNWQPFTEPSRGFDPRANLGRCMLADIPDQAKGAVLGLNAVELYGLNVQTK